MAGIGIILVGIPATLVVTKVAALVIKYHVHGARRPAVALPSQSTDTPLHTSLAFVDAVVNGRRGKFVELVRFPDGISETRAAVLHDELFRRWTAQYARWQFGAVREGRQRDAQGIQQLELRYRDPDTDHEDGLLIYLKSYPGGWRVYVNDVPIGSPSAAAASNP